MTNPTLSIFTGGQNLGHVYNEEVTLTVKFWEVTEPGSNDEGRMSAQIGGKIRGIMVQGIHDGTGFYAGGTPDQKINDFLYTIDAWANLPQQDSVSVTYTDSFGNVYEVDCVEWTWKRSSKTPGRILYTLIFKRV
jgi:hypothetical protein